MSTLTLRAVSSRNLQIPGVDSWYAAPGDPALSVMTDFPERASVTITETATTTRRLLSQ